VFALKQKKKSHRKSVPWNKGVAVGSKRPLTLKQIHAIRVRLKAPGRMRELALFNLAIDSSLNATDLVQLRVRDIAKGHRVLSLATLPQRESQRPIQFWISAETRKALAAWIAHKTLSANQYLFPTRLHASPFISVRQYARLIEAWVGDIGLDDSCYGTESLRRTKPALVYRRTKNLPAAQSLLRHVKLESTARYLGV
jgi:integrase